MPWQKWVFLCFSFKAKWERSLAPDVISPEPVDRFKKFKRRLEAEKILHKLYRIDFLNFCLSKIFFSLNFF